MHSIGLRTIKKLGFRPRQSLAINCRLAPGMTFWASVCNRQMSSCSRRTGTTETRKPDGRGTLKITTKNQGAKAKTHQIQGTGQDGHNFGVFARPACGVPRIFPFWRSWTRSLVRRRSRVCRQPADALCSSRWRLNESGMYLRIASRLANGEKKKRASRPSTSMHRTICSMGLVLQLSSMNQQANSLS